MSDYPKTELREENNDRFIMTIQKLQQELKREKKKSAKQIQKTCQSKHHQD
jgi:hypothetical protein